LAGLFLLKDLREKVINDIIIVVTLNTYALVAQSDRAVVSGTTSAGGSNPSERANKYRDSKDGSLPPCYFFVQKQFANLRVTL
jgi:hypothetical protein